MLMTILLLLLFGALVGWIAGIIMKRQRSLLGNIIYGIIGSFVGSFIASLLGFGSFGADFSFNLVNILMSVAGACLVCFIVGGRRDRKR